MEIVNIFDQLYGNVLDTTLLEIIAVLFGLFSVWFAKKENILVYPTGIINVLIYVYICFFAGLYADMGINFFYFIMSVYGWYSWTRIDINKKALPISSCNKNYHILNVIAFIFFFFVIRYVLINYTDSTVPNWDSLTTAIFIIAMWLMARKKVENWIAWIIGDIISIPLYAYKGLVFTSFQFTIFLIIAIMGYIAWRKKLLASKVV